MSTYMLYDKKLIDDDTSFAAVMRSLLEGIDGDYGLAPDPEEYRDGFEEAFADRLEELFRTDADYEALMYNIRGELGDVLYEMDNRGLPLPELHFFGTSAKETFEVLASFYAAEAKFGGNDSLCRRAYENTLHGGGDGQG